MSADVPASWLRLAGPRLEVVADEDAASELATLRPADAALAQPEE